MLLVYLMIQCVSGLVGGNAAGSVFRTGATRTAANSLLGAVGGVTCAQLLSLGGLQSGFLDLASMGIHIASAMLGGSVLVFATTLLRDWTRDAR